jgi:hypothetical protein
VSLSHSDWPELKGKYFYPISLVNQPSFVTFWVNILKNSDEDREMGFKSLESLSEDFEENDRLYYKLNKKYIKNISSKLVNRNFM